MKYSEVKELITIANEYGIDKAELIENISNNENDFEVENYRFIKESAVLEEAVNMYRGDNYMLGCFSASFIADNTKLSYNVVKALQKAEVFEELGELINDEGIEDFIEEYGRLDGWGHVFGSYDGNNDEVNILGEDFIVFRTN
jgi:MoaA/NifB/PqqE/SkfB family radical SAM enzyme